MRYDRDAFGPTGGPLQVSFANYYEPFSDAVSNGLTKSGLSKIAGLNSGSLLGYAEIALTIDPRTATRSSSETSFLWAAIADSTLQVYQQALAKRVIFDNNKVASGVEISMAGATSFLSARKEVILACGAVSMSTRP